MLSVLLLGFDGAGRGPAEPGDLVRTLASLVPATVEGLVRDLCLAGPERSPALADVADHAGCSLVRGSGFSDAVVSGSRSLRCLRVLALQPGVMIGRPVIDELFTLLPAIEQEHGAFHLLKSERRDLLGRLLPLTAPPAGLLAPRAWLQQSRAGRFADLVSHAKPRRVLRSVAWPAA